MINNNISPKLILATLFLSAVFAVAAVPVNAQNASVRPGGGAGKNATAAAEKMQAKCQEVVARVTQRLATSSAVIAEKEQHVADRKAAWATQIARLKEKGIDTTKYEADVKQAETLLDKWITDVKAYVTTLQGISTPDCSDPAAVRAAIKQAQDGAKTLRADQKAMQDFRKTIKPDLESLRTQLKGMMSSSRPSRSPRASASPQS
jgi:chromosome segregation ATPase